MNIIARFLSALSRAHRRPKACPKALLLLATLLFGFADRAYAVSGVTYSGRILDANNNPVTSTNVKFNISIYDSDGKCWLYTEQRQLDLSLSSGTFAIDIGSNDSSLIPSTAQFNNEISPTGVKSLSDVFNNIKSFTGLGTANGCSGSFTPNPGNLNAGRQLVVYFSVDNGAVQALPVIKINPVPAALTVGGYSSGELLRLDSTVNPLLNTNPNDALTQAQYDEFWRLVKNPLAAYLPTTGEVLIDSGNNKVTKLLGQALPATGTNGQALVYGTGGWSFQSLSSGSVTGVTSNPPLIVTGTATAPIINLPAASSSGDGYLTSADWNTFNSKQSGALAQNHIWIGNSSGSAEAKELSGDASLLADGTLTLKNTGTAGTYGSASSVPVFTTDAKGRVTSVTATTVDDTTKLPLAGGSMSGTINMGGNDLNNVGNINIAANKYLGLADTNTPGNIEGQVWYDNGKIKYWDGSSSIELGAAGAGITSFNGLNAGSQTFTIGTAGNSPAFNSVTDTHTLNIPMASASGSVTAGLLSNADYVSMMSKMSNALASGQVWVGNASGGAEAHVLSGDVFSVSNTGSVTIVKTTTGEDNKILALDGSGVANVYGAAIKGATSGDVTLLAPTNVTSYSLTFPAVQGGADQVLANNGSGGLTWASPLLGVSDSADLANGKVWIGNASGKASEVTLSGDATITNAGLMTLKSVGTAGTYFKVETDAQGRVVAGANLVAGDITTALGYTPVNKAGDTMSGALNMGGQDLVNTGNITMTDNKYFGLSKNNSDSSTEGQMWFDAGLIKYYDGATVQTLGVQGLGVTHINGLTAAAQSFTIGTAGNSPAFNSVTDTHTLNIPMASASGSVTAGLISNADYVSMMGKQSNALAAAQVWVGNASGGAEARTLSGDVTLSAVGLATVDKTQTAQAGKILQLDGSSVAVTKGVDINGAASGTIALRGQAAAGTYTLTLPDSPGSANQVLQTDGSGVLSWGSALSGVTDTAPLANGKVWIGNGSGMAAEVTLSGDATITNAGLMTLKSVGTAGTYFKVETDAQGRVVAGGNLVAGDITTALGYTPVNRAGDTMSGALNMGGHDVANTGNITMADNKYFGLSKNNSDSSTEGQMWFDAGLIKYYDGATVQTLGVQGLGVTHINGLTAAAQSLTVGTSGNAPAFNSVTDTHTLNIPMASASGSVTSGLISNADYVSMMSKQSNALSTAQVWVGNASGGAEARALSGDIFSVSDAGSVTIVKTTTGEDNKILALDGSGVANVYGAAIKGATSGDVTLLAPTNVTSYSLTFPAVQGGADQVLSNDGSGGLTWASPLLGVSDSADLANGKVWIGNASGKAAEVTLSGDATITNAGLMTLKSVGTAGTYFKVETDAQGRVVAGGNLVAGDITTALGYTPVNRAGDTMSGALNMGGQDLVNTGNITMTDNKYFGLSKNNSDSSTEGQMWFDAGLIKYYDGATVQTLGVQGLGVTHINGLTAASQSFTVGTSGNAPAFNSVTDTHTLNIPMASASGSVTAGLLSNADYVSMMSKQSNALSAAQVWVGNASGGAEAREMSGDVTLSSVGLATVDKTQVAANSKILQLSATGTAFTKGVDINGGGAGSLQIRYPSSGTTTALTFPASTGSANQVLQTDGLGVLSWASVLSGVTDTAPLANGKVWIGNGSGMASEVTLSGDATITNAGLITLKSVGTAGTYFKVETDAQGRVVAGANLAAADITTALAYTPVNRAGDTMSGALNMGGQDLVNTGNITMADNKYFGLSKNNSDSSTEGQMWFDAGLIKYYDGATVQTLGVQGLGVTHINGLTAAAQSFTVGSSGNAPAFNSVTDTHTLNIPMASASGSVTAGLISNSDYIIMMSKQNNALTTAQVWVGNASGGAQARVLSGDVFSVSDAGSVTIVKTTTGEDNKILALDGSGVANVYGAAIKGATSGDVTLLAPTNVTSYSLTFPAVQGGADQVLANDGSGGLTWASPLLGVSDSADLANGKVWIGNASGKAAEVTLSGDATITNAGLMTLKSVGTAGTYFKVETDAQGRVIAGANLVSSDITTALGYSPVNKAGDTMSGALNMGGQDVSNTGNITMADNKYFGLSKNNSDSSTEGQMWFDGGLIKYYDGATVQTLGVQGLGVTHINGLTAAAQSFTVGTAGNSPAFNSVTDTHTLNLPMASASGSVTAGLISNSDYSTLMNKQSNALSAAQVWVGNTSGGAEARELSGDVTLSAVGFATVDKTQVATNSKILQLSATGTAFTKGVDVNGGGAGSLQLRYPSSGTTTALTFPASTGSANQVLQTDGLGVLSWATVLTGVSDTAGLANGKLWIGNVSGIASEVTLSGDATITNAGLMTLKSVGTAGTYFKVETDAQGRVVAGANLAAADITTALGYTPVNKAGDTMSGALNMGGQDLANTGSITMADNKYFGLSKNNSDSSTEGQMWFDGGLIKYYDGATVQTLGVQGLGVTHINGLTAAAQSFTVGTSGNAPAFNSVTDTHTLNIPMASASGAVTAGLISNSDYVSMMGKQSNTLAAGEIWVGNASGGAQARALSGDIYSVSDVGSVTVLKSTTGTADQIVALDGSGVGTMSGLALKNTGSVTLAASTASNTYGLNFPAAAPANNQSLKSDGSGNLTWFSALDAVSNTAGLTNGNIWVGNASNVAAEVASNSLFIMKGGQNAGAALNLGTTDNYAVNLLVNNQNKLSVHSGGIMVNGSQELIDYNSSVYATSSGSARYPDGGSTVFINNYEELSSTASYLKFEVYNSSSNTQNAYIGVVSALGAVTYTPAVVFGQTSGSNAYTETMRLHSNRNVGIGATAPATKLDVSGVTRSTGMDINATYGGSQVQLRAPASFSTYTLTLPADDGLANQFLTTNGSGVLSWSSPATVAGGVMYTTATEQAVSAAGSTGQLLISGGTGAPTWSTVTADGSGNINAAAYYYTSDRRLKKDFADIKGLETILALHGVSFKWRNNDEPEIGLIAQEVEKVLPELVRTDKVTGMKAVKYGNIVAPLIESVKDLHGMCLNNSQRLDKVERKLAADDNRLQVLEKTIRTLQDENAELKAQIQEIKEMLKNRK